MQFKTPQIETEFRTKLRWRTKMLAFAMDAYMQFTFGVELFITSIVRESSKYHRYGYSFDARDNLTEEQGDLMVTTFNIRMPYGPQPNKKKKTLTIRDERKPNTSEHWTAAHFHVSSNWRMKDRW